MAIKINNQSQIIDLNGFRICANEPSPKQNGDIWMSGSDIIIYSDDKDNNLSNLTNKHVCEGRLTLTSGTPVTTSDVTSAGTIYFTPYNGNTVRLYDGTNWKYHQFSEVSLSLSGQISTDEIKDVFLYDNSGTLTLELSADWTDDTTRADALTLQDEVWVKSGAETRLYLGTIRGTGSGTTEDSDSKLFVANYYNAVPKRIARRDSTDGSYSTATYRILHNDADNIIEFVCAMPQVIPISIATVAIDGANSQMELDSTDGSNLLFQRANLSTISSQITIGQTDVAVVSEAGYHYFAMVQHGGSGEYWYDFSIDASPKV